MSKKSPQLDIDAPASDRVNTRARKRQSATAATPGIDDTPNMDTMPNAATAPTQTENPMRQVTIGGVAFSIEDKYAEGHVLNANEAASLNQTRAENIGNNFRSTIAEAREKAYLESVGREELEADEKVPSDYPLSDEVKAQLQAALTEAAQTYEFGQRGGGGPRITDPVQREAQRIARDKIEAAIKAKHGKLDAVPAEERRNLIEQLANREDVQRLAKANVEAASELVADIGI